MWEQRAKEAGYLMPAGIDEAGRGPLAGPVVASAVYLESLELIEGLADSKALTEKRRKIAFEQLKSTPGVHIGVGICTAQEIDEINILQATFRAMERAVEDLDIEPDYLFVDGNLSPKMDIEIETVVKGDAKVKSISAASIIAKVTRDEMMVAYHEKCPQYGFDRHKGYGTKAHLEAIKIHGPTEIHRMTFAPLNRLQKSLV